MSPIPDEVAQFIGRSIDSVEQLEALRVLGDDPAREWTADDLAKAVQATPAAMTAHLAALEARGLVAVTRAGATVTGRHGPATPELAALLARVLAVYRERPVTLIRMVYAARSPLRSFADAFRLRKGE